MPDPREIVVVCTANVCRSPMAAALLQHARAVAPRLLEEHDSAAQAHVQRWLASRVEFLKA